MDLTKKELYCVSGFRYDLARIQMMSSGAWELFYCSFLSNGYTDRLSLNNFYKMIVAPEKHTASHFQAQQEKLGLFCPGFSIRYSLFSLVLTGSVNHFCPGY